MARRDWLAGIASIAFLVVCFAVFGVLYKILKDRVPEFVMYVLAPIWLAIAFFGNKAIEGRIKSRKGPINNVQSKVTSMGLTMRLLLLVGAIAAAIAMYGPQGLVWTPSKPAKVTAAEQERADCVERYRKGQRMTEAGC